MLRPVLLARYAKIDFGYKPSLFEWCIDSSGINSVKGVKICYQPIRFRKQCH